MRHPALLRTRGSYESLAGDNRETNRVWPVRPTRGVNRGYQAGVLKADGSLANFTSVSAPTIYRGGTLPAELNGNVFVVEPAGNLVARIVLQDDGSTLRARKAYEAASSWCRPTSASGPSTSPRLPTARSTSSTCIAASSSTRSGTLPYTCATTFWDTPWSSRSATAASGV